MKIFIGYLLMSTPRPRTFTYSPAFVSLVEDRYFLYVIIPQRGVLSMIIIITIMVLLLCTGQFYKHFPCIQIDPYYYLYHLEYPSMGFGLTAGPIPHPSPVHQKICGTHTYTSAATATIQKYISQRQSQVIHSKIIPWQDSHRYLSELWHLRSCRQTQLLRQAADFHQYYPGNSQPGS